MIMNTENRKWDSLTCSLSHLLTFILLLTTTAAKADLTAEVLPGYTFGTSERPTTSTLNRLGLPTIRITGTVGGTNAGISAGSITGTMLSDSTVDATTIYFNGSRQIAVIPYSVGTNSLSNNICGFGLTGGNGSQLSVTYDTNYFTVGTTNLNSGTNGLTLLPGLFAVISNSYWLQTNTFTTTNITITAGATYDAPHFLGPLVTNIAGINSFTNAPLGWNPRSVRWVLVCVTAHSGYAVGDEISVESVAGRDDDQYHSPYPLFTGGANSTNVFITCNVATTDSKIMTKGAASAGTWQDTKWKLKCYASP
jgi:hypothetical protein